MDPEEPLDPQIQVRKKSLRQTTEKTSREGSEGLNFLMRSDVIDDVVRAETTHGRPWCVSGNYGNRIASRW